MPQPKDHDPDNTDPVYKQHWHGHRSSMANANASVGNGGNGSLFKWLAALGGAVIGAIIIAQLNFFGSAVIEQGKVIVRLDERMAAMQDAVKQQGQTYAEYRREINDRIGRIEQRGEGSRR